MSDDLREKLEGYKIQLEQVEAMLTTDPDNKELQRLRDDLNDVIILSSQLVVDKQSSATGGASTSATASGTSKSRFKAVGDSSTELPTASGTGQKRKNREEEQKRREYLLAKKAKKQARHNEIEQAHEAEKKRWQDFNSKIMKHNKTHLTKNSIFATTDNLNGRVGVGTCGISGKPITPAPALQPQRPAAHPNASAAAAPKQFGLDRLTF